MVPAYQMEKRKNKTHTEIDWRETYEFGTTRDFASKI